MPAQNYDGYTPTSLMLLVKNTNNGGGKDRKIVTQNAQAMDGKIHTVPVTKDYRDDVINIYNNKNASTPAATLKADEAKQILNDHETR